MYVSRGSTSRERHPPVPAATIPPSSSRTRTPRCGATRSRRWTRSPTVSPRACSPWARDRASRWRCTPDTVEHCLADSEARIVITDPQAWSRVRGARQRFTDLEHVLMVGEPAAGERAAVGERAFDDCLFYGLPARPPKADRRTRTARPGHVLHPLKGDRRRGRGGISPSPASRRFLNSRGCRRGGDRVRPRDRERGHVHDAPHRDGLGDDTRGARGADDDRADGHPAAEDALRRGARASVAATRRLAVVAPICRSSADRRLPERML